jgi:hypothetical protein
MRRVAAATTNPIDCSISVNRVVRRPSATFLVLQPVSGARPELGVYGGDVELDGVRASCSIRVVDTVRGRELWCQPRGPLPRAVGGDTLTLRFGAR